MSDLLLAIDVGTTGVRAAVFDAQGRVLGQADEACPYQRPVPGWAEADAEGWWRAVCAALARIGPQISLSCVGALGVTGQAPTAVLVDERGQVLRPAILWLDVRAEVEARAIEAALGPGRAEAIGGNRMHAYYLGPKLAWLRAHEPQTLARAARVLQSHAFIVQRLTGEAVCDASAAMLCAPLFDAHARAWSEEGARPTGVALRQLPRLVRAHEVIGRVTRAGAEQSGLPEGTPVVAGGGDFAASALGAGVIEEGQACLMLGTAGNLLMPMRKPRFDPRLINSHHVGCDRWLVLGGTLCGAALAWFRQACAPDASWDALDAEAAAAALESMGGLLTLPYLQGERTPIWDENARAAFFGMGLNHGRGHLYRALLEGVALSFRHCLEVAREHGAVFKEVIAANGAGRSALFRQILSDALGLPLAWTGGAGSHGEGVEGASATLRGAALLAGLGVGWFEGAEVARAWCSPLVRHEPNARAHERLCDVFSRRNDLYAAVRAIASDRTSCD